jgi:hypothetical protein
MDSSTRYMMHSADPPSHVCQTDRPCLNLVSQYTLWRAVKLPLCVLLWLGALASSNAFAAPLRIQNLSQQQPSANVNGSQAETGAAPSAEAFYSKIGFSSESAPHTAPIGAARKTQHGRGLKWRDDTYGENPDTGVTDWKWTLDIYREASTVSPGGALQESAGTPARRCRKRSVINVL